MHIVFVVGNLGRDPRLDYVNDDKPVCHFPLASNRHHSSGESVTWFRVTVWGRLAELCSEHLRRGSLIAAYGRLEPSPTGSPAVYESSEGHRANYDLTAYEIKFLGRKQHEDQHR